MMETHLMEIRVNLMDSHCLPLQIQHAVPKTDPEMGERFVEHERCSRAVVICTESLGLSRSRIRWWRYR